MRTTDAAEQKKIAADIQKRAYDDVMWIPAGIYYQPSAWRTNVTGVLKAPVPFFWNMEKK